MHLSLTERERELQEEVRSFLERALPELDPLPANFDERVTPLRAWQRGLHEAGLVGLSWPREHGGRGATLTEQIVANQEMARAGAPPLIGNVGIDVVGPSLVEHGTEDQKSRFLDRILAADDIWCQGFSETGAGSDLASLKTRASVDDDGFRISGHKIWTSYAQHAQWCAVLARTDRDAPAHKGISYLLVDMSSPGIEVRPLVQVTGDPEFGEVYFDDVFVPAANLLGPLHGGWRIAMHTLAHERGWYGLGRQVILRVLLDRLIEDARRLRRRGAPVIDDPAVRSSLARAHVGIEVLKHQGYRSVGKMIADGHPGPESSVDKVVLARVEQALADAALDVLGATAALHDAPVADVDPETWHHTYFYGRAASVYGGSVQIQRNIIAERILGLPRESLMDLELTEDQRELRGVARQLLDDVAPLRVARAFLDGDGEIAPVSSALADLGWYAVGIDDDPFGIPGLCLLAEQCGAHAAPTLLVDTAVAARIAGAIEDPAPLAARIAGGEVATALAVLEPGADWDLRGLASEAVRGESGYIVEARKFGVQHGATAEAFAIVTDCEGDPGVFFVPAGILGVSAVPAQGLDPASALATVTIAGVPVERGCSLAGEDASRALAAAFAVGAVATAAEGAGAASAALDLAVAYAKEREQFGRPIGQFQALQHVMAEAHVDREATWSTILYAAAALEESLPDALEATAVAKAQAARGTRAVVEAALQVLGGIAFTWEHDVHLLQRRVLTCERRFGDAIVHERALGDRLADRALEGIA